MRILSVLAVGLLTLASSLQPVLAAEPTEVTVYAAASLGGVLEAVAPACEKATGTKLVFNFGASNDLARQIQAANKADVFISADESWMDKVAAAGLVDAESRRDLLSNRLVVIGAPGVSFTIASAADLAHAPVKYISLANPEAVPAGKYAKAWLESQGQWEAVRPRVLPGADVRAALAAVEAGAADIGLVYATDASISSKVRVLYAVPESEGPRIRYAIAALKDRPSLQKSRDIVAWMASPEAMKVFQRFGFTLPTAK